MAPECLKCVEMIIFWISGVNRVTLLLRLISSVSFDFFFNVATRNFLTSVCGSHFVFTGENWPRRSQAHWYAPLHLCFTKGSGRGCGKQATTSAGWLWAAGTPPARKGQCPLTAKRGNESPPTFPEEYFSGY